MQAVISDINKQGSGIAISSPAALSFDDSVAVGLPNIPVNALTALIVLEASATAANPQSAAKFTEANGQTPTAAFGTPLGNLGYYTIEGKDNINNFKIIGVEAGKTHTLQITYFS
jgi:hypothetical protein